jgi:hypothetical protein
MIIIRSFDVNHPGEEVGTLKGGVAGGSILQGVLRVGDEVEIRPGHSRKADDGSFRCNPIFSRITTLKAESNELQFAVPGGLIGVGLLVDPTLTRADRLVGQVLGTKGSLPDIFVEIEVRFYLLKKLLGVKTADGEKAAKVSKLVKGEMLMANIGSTSVGARVMACALAEESKEGVVQKKSSEGVVTLSLTQPVCTLAMEKVALSRRIEGHWRCVGGFPPSCCPPAPPPPASPFAAPVIRQHKLSLSEGQKRPVERKLYPMSGLMRQPRGGVGEGVTGCGGVGGGGGRLPPLSQLTPQPAPPHTHHIPLQANWVGRDSKGAANGGRREWRVCRGCSKNSVRHRRRG